MAEILQNAGEITKDEAIEAWLINREGKYKQQCRLAFIKFRRFLKEKYGLEMNGDSILAKHVANRKSDDKKVKYFFDDAIKTFVLWMEEQGNAHNSAVVQSGMVRSFFKHHREKLEVVDGINFKETRKRYHIYTRDELMKMVEVGDLEAQALIMLGLQLGIRVNDFVALKRQTIVEAYQNANGEFPLEFEIDTQKEGVISVGHISKEVYDVLHFYWTSLHKENVPDSEWAFPYNGSHIIDQRANDILKSCYLKAYPDRTTQKIRFHELRSFKISTLTNKGINQWAIQKMTGKKVSQDINTYLTGINLKELFLKAEQELNLTQTINGNHRQDIEELKKENKELKAEQYDLKEQLRILADKVEAMQEEWRASFTSDPDEIIREFNLNKKKALEHQQKESPNT